MSALQDIKARYRDARSRLGVMPPPPRRRILIPPKVTAVTKEYERPLENERKRLVPIGFDAAVALVEEQTDVPARMLLNGVSPHYQVAAAREMLWTVLFDSGRRPPEIAQQWGISAADVRLGVARFRAFAADRQMFGTGR